MTGWHASHFCPSRPMTTYPEVADSPSANGIVPNVRTTATINSTWDTASEWVESQDVNVKVLGANTFPGDANYDGVVNINDLSKVLTNYDKTGKAWADGDFNFDGTVNVSDLSIVLTNYDKTAGASLVPVPEPSTLVLLAVLMSVLGWVINRRR